ncbi:hypothetical protein C900_05474 [Fulvivirga imtechensis AK7]|uniref:Uncharacterized protein n=1 Tax=Fulvivirga imtechensis AK7 TaxID=1237149 RepID=L8JJU8_9BACT|nr:DUF6232 family protein [Fulvivirga imtechensis]ELR69085.1 hypothetical protein C900_05474 [Fulvivirga imtechensis AK7]
MREEVIYTDGHGVKITRDKFYTEKKEYNLDGITHVDLSRVPASKAPGVILFVLGFLAILAGSLEIFDRLTYEAAEAIYVIDTNMVAIGLGVALILGGIIWMIAARDKYAVEIGTAEGEKQPIVSKSREYAALVVASLKKAYYRYTDKGRYSGRERVTSREQVVIS